MLTACVCIVYCVYCTVFYCAVLYSINVMQALCKSYIVCLILCVLCISHIMFLYRIVCAILYIASIGYCMGKLCTVDVSPVLHVFALLTVHQYSVPCVLVLYCISTTSS